MSLKEIQKQVDDWAQQFKKPYFEPLVQMACLTEETGEVARELNHLYGEKKRKSSEPEGNLGQELSQMLFTVSCIANSQGIDLQKEFDKMMEEKYYKRDANRYEKKE